MKLVTFNCSWADEFNAEGFAVFTDEDWVKAEEYLSQPREWYFGTNEGWEDEVFLDSCNVQDITEEEAATLCKLFPDLVRKTHSFEYQGKTRTYTTGGDYGIFPPITSDDDE